jgi:hypothetical protein
MFSGMIFIVSVILLRNRLFDLESMVIWKWSEAPWWTRMDEDEAFQTHLANLTQARASQVDDCRLNASQSGTTVAENRPRAPGSSEH